MEVVIAIDDTDNLESRGTGDLASEIAARVEQAGWGKSSYVTRHQLYVHQDIPYTSHNSAMCFTAEIGEECLPALIEQAATYLTRESAPGSDPGLCIATVAALKDPKKLLSFGRKAKETVLTKEEAYDLAGQLGVHLSEHGGTGQGVIGALAGVGLRLGGNDGRLKGNIDFPAVDGITTVDRLCSHPLIDSVQTTEGLVLEPGARVRVTDRLKTVLLQGQSVLLVKPADGGGIAEWQVLLKQQLKRY
ncbi:hypothetical protein LPW11_02055 [Geomonas sp. RF6]|uniref:hypothetical protein n=1 Tax=Geomonas sp. RF6 TaxID=2897342 RepID=UPI001E628B82|nr:hypothetical protein [Geomonas sp. RF6]UFS70981.1 hypothetical protein LPW11_02055 [Geomonas sp. RF6]